MTGILDLKEKPLEGIEDALKRYVRIFSNPKFRSNTILWVLLKKNRRSMDRWLSWTMHKFQINKTIQWYKLRNIMTMLQVFKNS